MDQYKPTQEKIRTQRILNYFQGSHVLYDEQLKLPQMQRMIPKWFPPKANLKETVQDIIELFQITFEEKKIVDDMAKSLKSIGCFQFLILT